MAVDDIMHLPPPAQEQRHTAASGAVVFVSVCVVAPPRAGVQEFPPDTHRRLEDIRAFRALPRPEIKMAVPIEHSSSIIGQEQNEEGIITSR